MTDEQIKLLYEKVGSKMIRDDTFRSLGLLLLNFELVQEYNSHIKIAAVDRYDKKIFINCNEDSLLFKYNIEHLLAFLLIHELFHVILLHRERLKDKIVWVWNIAGDFVINNLIKMLKDHSSLHLIEWIDEYEKDFCYSEKFQNMIEEEVYETLLSKECNFQMIEKDISVPLNKIDASIRHVFENAEKDSQGNIKFIGKQYSFEVDGKKFEQTEIFHPDIPDITEEDAHQETLQESNELVERTKNIFLHTVTKGNGQSPVSKLLNRIFEIKVD